jgi:hypothetical protein
MHFEALYLFKKPHQNPLSSFKDLTINRQTTGSDFGLYYVVCYIIERSSMVERSVRSASERES